MAITFNDLAIAVSSDTFGPKRISAEGLRNEEASGIYRIFASLIARRLHPFNGDNTISPPDLYQPIGHAFSRAKVDKVLFALLKAGYLTEYGSIYKFVYKDTPNRFNIFRFIAGSPTITDQKYNIMHNGYIDVNAINFPDEIFRNHIVYTLEVPLGSGVRAIRRVAVGKVGGEWKFLYWATHLFHRTLNAIIDGLELTNEASVLDTLFTNTALYYSVGDFRIFSGSINNRTALHGVNEFLSAYKLKLGEFDTYLSCELTSRSDSGQTAYLTRYNMNPVLFHVKATNCFPTLWNDR